MYESTLTARDGHIIPVEVHVHRVVMEGADHLQWILRDISERKRLAALQDDLIAWCTRSALSVSKCGVESRFAGFALAPAA